MSRPLKSTPTPRSAIRARVGQHNMHTTFAIESNDSPVPGIMPEPVHVHDEPATTAPRGERQATRNPVSNEQTKLEVE
jgi:hypothetical protein